MPKTVKQGSFNHSNEEMQIDKTELSDTVDCFYAATIGSYLKNVCLPTHSQRGETNEIIFVTEGFLIRGCNLQAIQVNPDELHVLLPGQITSIHSQAHTVKGYYSRFNNQFLQHIHTKDNLTQELAFINSFMRRYPLRLDTEVSQRVAFCFESIIQLYSDPEADSDLIRAYLTTIIGETKRILLQGVTDPYPSKPFQIAKKYNDLLVEHITQNQHLEFYASLLGVSQNHLNKSVKITTGKTAGMLLNEARMLEAKIQLKHSEASVSDIAFNLGFDDASYFTKCFRKASGLTPLEYRKL